METIIYKIEKLLDHGWTECAPSWFENELEKAKNNLNILRDKNPRSKFRIIKHTVLIKDEIIDFEDEEGGAADREEIIKYYA